MRIETLPLSALQPAPYNPRKKLRPGMPAYERLKRSLAEFDLVQPIVWNRTTGHVVGGHQRLQILQDRGDTSVECVVIEVSLEREKALNVALNNTQVGGDWDHSLLGELLGELQQIPDFDPTLTGFSAADFKHLCFEPNATLTADDEADNTGQIQITLDVPRDDWDDLRPALDQVLAEYPQIRTHVRDNTPRATQRTPQRRT